MNLFLWQVSVGLAETRQRRQLLLFEAARKGPAVGAGSYESERTVWVWGKRGEWVLGSGCGVVGGEGNTKRREHGGGS